jgi:glucosamine--fructose-6-phosphate aminotransferase (isomerizing)
MFSRHLIAAKSIRRLATGTLTVTPNHRVISPLLLGSLSTAANGDRNDGSTRLNLLAAGVASLLTLGAVVSQKRDSADCCGIIGVVGRKNNPRHDARDFLLEGLTILKNRGYDSAGIATIQEAGPDGTDHALKLTKFASNGDDADCIELLKEHSSKSAGHSTGIAHTRWATHGAKTDENAHPHRDSTGKIALVHNGTINNATQLRNELQAKGHMFSSQTDTEVIVKLIGHIKEEKKCSLKDATEAALQRCDGSWGLCLISLDEPDCMVVACNGSPLVIGIGDDRTFVASETTAFNRYTKEYISVKDGEIGVLHADGRTLDLSRAETAPDHEVTLSPDPYPHWTLKECVEQPEAIARALCFGGRLSEDKVILGGLDKKFDQLVNIKHMTMSACGTSLNAARYAEKLMKNLGSFESVYSIDASETQAKDFPNSTKSQESGLIVVSQSGETKDVVRVVNTAMDKNVAVMSVVNAVGSLIARTTKLGVYCNAGRENAVASTKAFTTQVTTLALIALWFRQAREKISSGTRNTTSDSAATELREALMRLPISFGMAMNTRPECKKIAERLVDKEHLFLLGKGYGEPVALEGALKIKECCYLHAEGYSGGALKHGPFALIEGEDGKFGSTPIILLIFDDEHANLMRCVGEEVKARGAELIVITDRKKLAEGLDPNPLVIPQNGPLTALGAVLPLQLIAYELALLKGINPDTPRNLAKAVTVD